MLDIALGCFLGWFLGCAAWNLISGALSSVRNELQANDNRKNFEDFMRRSRTPEYLGSDTYKSTIYRQWPQLQWGSFNHMNSLGKEYKNEQ